MCSLMPFFAAALLQFLDPYTALYQTDDDREGRALASEPGPAMVPIIVLMTTLNIGYILSAGFNQVFNLLKPIVMDSGDILDTLVYRIGFTSGQFGISTAANLTKSLVSLALITISYKLAYKLTGYKVF